MTRFDLEKFCHLVQKHKITFTYVAPPVVLLLGKSPIVDKYDLSSLKMINSGAAPLTRELTDAVYKRLNIPVKQAYGLSETSPSAIMQVDLFPTSFTHAPLMLTPWHRNGKTGKDTVGRSEPWTQT